MKKKTYRLLTKIPIIGGLVKSITQPIWVTGSLARESGLADENLRLFEEYSKTHPDEQLTQQLIERLVKEKSGS